MPDTFTFDTSTRRYRNQRTGKFVSAKKIDSLAEVQMSKGIRRLTAISLDLSKGRIGLGEWERRIAGELKTLHIQQYKLGVGNMTQRDYGILGSKLRVEYRYLRNFAAEIAIGRVSESQLLARVKQYASATWSSYQRGKREGFTRAGIRWEKRILNSRIPCSDCPTYASAGWVPAGFLPGVGEECECRSNCKCSFVYSFGQTRPESQSILSHSFGWINGY